MCGNVKIKKHWLLEPAKEVKRKIHIIRKDYMTSIPLRRVRPQVLLGDSLTFRTPSSELEFRAVSQWSSNEYEQHQNYSWADPNSHLTTCLHLFFVEQSEGNHVLPYSFLQALICVVSQIGDSYLSVRRQSLQLYKTYLSGFKLA